MISPSRGRHDKSDESTAMMDACVEHYHVRWPRGARPEQNLARPSSRLTSQIILSASLCVCMWPTLRALISCDMNALERIVSHTKMIVMLQALINALLLNCPLTRTLLYPIVNCDSASKTLSEILTNSLPGPFRCQRFYEGTYVLSILFGVIIIIMMTRVKFQRFLLLGQVQKAH